MVSYASVDGRNAIIDEIRGVLVEGTGSRAAKLRRVAEMIRSARGYRWVGIYEVNDQEIAAVAWTGNEEPAHPRFSSSQQPGSVRRRRKLGRSGRGQRCHERPAIPHDL